MRHEEIARLLPDIFRRSCQPGNMLHAMVEAMELLQEPAEGALRNLPAMFDPYRTRDDFVAYLGGWLDLERLYDMAGPEGAAISTGTGRLRNLCAAAIVLAQWQGTAQGLKMFLEIATGLEGFTIQETVEDKEGRPKPFHIRVWAPAQAQPHKALVERIILQEKPAYATYELRFGEPAA